MMLVVIQYRSICVLYKENWENCIKLCFKEYFDKKIEIYPFSQRQFSALYLLKDYENELIIRKKIQLHNRALQFRICLKLRYTHVCFLEMVVVMKCYCDNIYFYIITSAILTMLLSMHTFAYGLHDLMQNIHYD